MRLLPPSAGNFFYNYPPVELVDEPHLPEIMTSAKPLLQIRPSTTPMPEPITIQTTTSMISSALESVADTALVADSNSLSMTYSSFTFLVVGMSLFLIFLFGYIVRFCLKRRERCRDAIIAYNNGENVSALGWVKNVIIQNEETEETEETENVAEVTQQRIEARLLDLTSPLSHPKPSILSENELVGEGENDTNQYEEVF